MNDRAGSVGVPKQSLYALQQRKCRQSLNLQELYKKLTSRRMSLLSGRCRVCGRLLRAKYDELPARVLFRNRPIRSEEHTSELQSQSNLVCRLLLEKKNIVQHH